MQWAPQTGVGFTTGKEWEAPQGDSLTRNVADEDRDPNSLLHLYRQLIHLRKANEAIATGRLVAVATSNARVVAYVRKAADGRSGPKGLPDGRGRAVIIVANLGDSAVAGLSISSAAGVLTPGRYATRNLLGGPAGSVFEVQADGSLRGTLSPPSLGGRESWVLELVRR